MPEKDLSPAFNKSGHISFTPVIVVPPSGGDDTQELTDAITSAEPGTIIKLLAGEYHVGFMEIYNFSGSLIGAGREKTIISLIAPISMDSQMTNNQTPGWWRMIGGDFIISDMTFRTPDGFLTDDYDPYFLGRDLYSVFMINNYNDVYYHPEGPAQKAKFERINFYGGTNPDMNQDVAWVSDHNVCMGIWIGVDYYWPADDLSYPLTAGDYVITNCYFDHFITAVEGFSLGERAIMKLNACKIDNCFWPLYFTANYNSNILITNNMLLNSTMYDLVIEDVDYSFLQSTPVNPLSRCKYTVMNNIFSVTNQIPSLVLCDTWVAVNPEERLPMQLLINGNQFNLSNGSSGILAINSQNAVISNNRFKGSCSTGIMVDGSLTDRSGTLSLDPDKAYAKNCHLMLNSFTGLRSDEADIILGSRSQNCTVVGSAKDKVIDDGTGNKVIGLRPIYKRYNIHTTFHDNFRMWHSRGHH
jgi:hypothetical protein